MFKGIAPPSQFPATVASGAPPRPNHACCRVRNTRNTFFFKKKVLSAHYMPTTCVRTMPAHRLYIVCTNAPRALHGELLIKSFNTCCLPTMVPLYAMADVSCKACSASSAPSTEISSESSSSSSESMWSSSCKSLLSTSRMVP